MKNGISTLTFEKKKRLADLHNKYKVTWEWGEQEATELFDQTLANFLNRSYGQTVVRLKKEQTSYR